MTVAVTRVWIFLAGALATCAPMWGQTPANSPRADFPAPDTTATCSAIVNNTLYVGGYFSRIGTNAGNFGGVDTSNASLHSGLPSTDGDVNAMCDDGAGGWYIAGNFGQVGTVRRRGVAHVLSNGALAPWDPDPALEVRAIALGPDRAYIGGLGYLASVNLTTGATITSYNVTGAVNVLTAAGGTVYVGGSSLTAVNGNSRSNIAALNAATGALISFAPAVNGGVSAICVSEGLAYIGGNFSTVAGSPRTNMAAVDVATAQPTAFDPAPNGGVFAIAVDGGTVFAGGTFTSVGGFARTRVAALSSTGQVLPWNVQVAAAPGDNRTPQVYAISARAGVVRIGGFFEQLAGQIREFVGAVDATTGQLLPWNPAPFGGVQPFVKAIVDSGNDVALGGRFTIAGGQDRVALAAIDLPTGALLPWTAQITPPAGKRLFVGSLQADAGRVYVNGWFATSVGATPTPILASLSAATGIPDPNFIPYGPPTKGSLLSLANGTLSLSCLGPDHIDSLCNFDAATGDLRWWASSAPLALWADPAGTVYVGRNGLLSAYDLVTGAARPWTIAVNNVQSIRTISGAAGTVYVGGSFTSFAGVARQGLAALDVSGPTPVLTAWNPMAANSSLSCVVARPDYVVISGGFETVGGLYRPMVAAANPSNAIGCIWNPQPGTSANLTMGPTALAATGGTVRFGGRLYSGLAVFDLLTCIADANDDCQVNVSDFSAFLQVYAAGEPRANCDHSTLPPVLNVADFTCFLQQYSAGCP